MQDSYTRSDLAFPSGGDEVAAWHYAPAGNAPAPVIVMAHGFSMTRHDGLPTYAEAFAAAGHHVLVFDHRNLGDSGGEKRQRFRAGEQRADWKAAVAHARTLPGVDPAKVVLWGYSFSGGHVTKLLTDGLDVSAALILCPFLDGFTRFRSTPISTAAWIVPRALADAAGRHTLIPVTAVPGSHGAMNQLGEYDGFHAAATPGSPWRNEISPAVFLTVPLFRPWRKAGKIGVPTWVGRFDADLSVDSAAIDKLVARAPHAELHEFRGDHFDPFHTTEAGDGTDGPDEVVAAQLAFLVRLFA